MEKDFRFFDLGQSSRLVLAGGLFALGLALQIALPGFVWPGVALVIAGWFPLMLRKATNKPDDQGLENWRPVTIAEIDRLDDSLRETKKLRRRSMSLVSILVASILGPIALMAFASTALYGRSDLAYLIGNACLLLVPALFFGRVSFFTPGDIAFKMPSFRAVLAEPLPAGLAVGPYIRFDKDAAGADVPEDLRLMLELKRPPADLVGVQIQAAVNKGPNGNVPYLYAVVLTKGRAGRSYDTARRFEPEGYEVEPGGDGDYGTVVIRQHTGGTGYHTTPADCKRLARTCAELLTRLPA